MLGVRRAEQDTRRCVRRSRLRDFPRREARVHGVERVVGDIAGEAERATASGNDRFWDLYRAGLPHVYGYLLRRSDRVTAEDVTQDVFVELARRARSTAGLEGLTVGWLLAVARSRLLDHVRAQQRGERKLRLAWSAAEPDVRSGMTGVDPTDEALAPAAERALEALPAIQRCALMLHHVDGYSVAEVAESIGRSVRATESLLARARRTFRTAFTEAADA
jgi:RNA polymerase sigma-70 factor (ECF subfamily)